MHFSLSQALLGLLATSIPSALATPAPATNDTNDTLGLALSPSRTTGTATATAASLEARDWKLTLPTCLACYRKKEGCKYKDVYMEMAKMYGERLCNKASEIWARPGWPGHVASLRNKAWVSYHFKVEWKEGCVSDALGDGSMSVGTPGLGISCIDLIWSTWRDCNNGGRGGTIDYGCLTYSYNIINGDEAGHGYCSNMPFDNSTFGSG